MGADDVAELKIDLTHRLVIVEEKKVATGLLIEEINVQKAAADIENEKANVEAEKAAVASGEAAVIEKQAEAELAEAEPAMKAAAAAVDCLEKSMLTELKSLSSPPSGVDLVTSVCLILLEREYKNFKWDRAKKMMANVDAFKARLQAYRGEDMTEEDIKRIEPFLSNEMFTVAVMTNKSAAAANLCTWVISIHKYNRIYVKVKPLMDSLESARATKAAAEESLAAAMAIVDELNQKLAQLDERLQAALKEKEEVEAQAAAGQTRLGYAERLVGGLASENVRWATEIDVMKESTTTLIGDCMLGAGFVSYVGAF